ncbi:MAG: T9SS type A sorting domain-containing protein, partial [Flavobacteriaceae bacterium]
TSQYTFYIPYGSPENRFKTRGNLTIQDDSEVPSVFPAGTSGQFCIITNGDAVQWEVITPGCNSASKSATGSNADPCDSSTALTGQVEVDSFTREFEEDAPQAYPNPATDYLTLFVGNMEGPVVRVSVFDEVGRQLMTREYPIGEGQAEVYMDISALKEGILTIVTESQGGRDAFRIIKQ